MGVPSLGWHTVQKATRTTNTNDTISPDINGLLGGFAWNAGVGYGSAKITYSFPNQSTSYGTSQGNGPGQYPAPYPFSGLTSLTMAQIGEVQRAFGLIAGYTGLTFQQVTEGVPTPTPTPPVRGTIRLANTSPVVHTSAVGFYPGANVESGDVFFGSTGRNPGIGNFDSARAVLHEIGHALGLKHGELVPPYGAEPSDHLGVEYSVMNYTTYIGQVGTDATEVPGSSPQSYMMDDIAALQYMYGANFGKVGQNVTYSWSSTTGQEFINNVGQGTPFQNRIFMTVWTEGATSTYDLSNFNENGSFDMRPGGSMRFSFQQLANLGAAPGDVNHLAKGNVYNAELYGTDTRSELDNLKVGNGSDFIYGNDVYDTITLGNGNDTVHGGTGGSQIFAGNGNDTLNGGDGNDVFDLTGGNYLVTGGLGTNTLDLTKLKQLNSQPFTITNNNGNGWVYEGTVLRVQFSGITSILNPKAPTAVNPPTNIGNTVPSDEVVDTEAPLAAANTVAPIPAEALGGPAALSFVSGTGSGDLLPSSSMTAGAAVDLTQLLSAYHISPGDTSQLAAYFQVTDPGSDATVLFNPDPMGGGHAAALAVLPGVGPDATLSSLISSGMLKLS
jgi:hypothetical protein